MGSHLDAFTMEGKVSLVTGGGRGIGLGIARALAGAGSDLLLVSRTETQLSAAARDIARDFGRRVEIISCDLTRIETFPGIVQRAIDCFGRLDVLINNAGSNIRSSFLEVSEADFDSVMQIQLKSAYFMAQAAAREMVKAGRGKIVNLTSLTSKLAIPNISIYGAAKGGIFSMTKALALELAAHNINVNAVAPGYVRTYMTEAAFRDKARCDWMLSRIPLGRFGTPEDIGNTALFLACPASDYLTGEVIFVDGGWMAA
jgi:NAD(P)-dependent dehydrogenase (short-subunit alcohol dehydrogenase family)